MLRMVSSVGLTCLLLLQLPGGSYTRRNLSHHCTEHVKFLDISMFYVDVPRPNIPVVMLKGSPAESGVQETVCALRLDGCNHRMCQECFDKGQVLYYVKVKNSWSPLCKVSKPFSNFDSTTFTEKLGELDKNLKSAPEGRSNIPDERKRELKGAQGSPHLKIDKEAEPKDANTTTKPFSGTRNSSQLGAKKTSIIHSSITSHDQLSTDSPKSLSTESFKSSSPQSSTIKHSSLQFQTNSSNTTSASLTTPSVLVLISGQTTAPSTPLNLLSLEGSSVATSAQTGDFSVPPTTTTILTSSISTGSSFGSSLHSTLTTKKTIKGSFITTPTRSSTLSTIGHLSMSANSTPVKEMPTLSSNPVPLVTADGVDQNTTSPIPEDIVKNEDSSRLAENWKWKYYTILGLFIFFLIVFLIIIAFLYLKLRKTKRSVQINGGRFSPGIGWEAPSGDRQPLTPQPPTENSTFRFGRGEEENKILGESLPR